MLILNLHKPKAEVSLPNLQKGSFFSRSVAARLLRIVFSLYFVVTLITTVCQLSSEYLRSEDAVIDLMKDTADAFHKPLAHSIWNIDELGIAETLAGITTNRAITGAVVTNEGGLNYSAGKIDESSLQVSKILEFAVSETEKQTLGTLTIFSTYGAILKRVEQSFYLIILFSMIKTLALWVIFFYFSNRLVAQPLTSLTHITQTFDPDHITHSQIAIGADILNRSDEVGVLAQNFKRLMGAIREKVTLIKKHLATIQEQNQHLEERIALRTRELEKKNPPDVGTPWYWTIPPRGRKSLHFAS